MGRIRGRREPPDGAADRAGVIPWRAPSEQASLGAEPDAAWREERGGKILDWVERQKQLLGRWWGARPVRQLRLCETLALGERRFLAVVECGGQNLLIGGGGGSLTLLKELSADGREKNDGNASGARAPEGTQS